MLVIHEKRILEGGFHLGFEPGPVGIYVTGLIFVQQSADAVTNGRIYSVMSKRRPESFAHARNTPSPFVRPVHCLTPGCRNSRPDRRVTVDQRAAIFAQSLMFARHLWVTCRVSRG